MLDKTSKVLLVVLAAGLWANVAVVVFKPTAALAQNEQAVATTGEVQSVDPVSGNIMLTHEPIPELNWPSMTMGFTAAENLSLDEFQPGETIRFEFRQTEAGFEILSVEPLAGGTP